MNKLKIISCGNVTPIYFFYATHDPLILKSMALRMIDHPEDAEDSVGVMFARCWKRRGEAEDIRKLRESLAPPPPPPAPVTARADAAGEGAAVAEAPSKPRGRGEGAVWEKRVCTV